MSKEKQVFDLIAIATDPSKQKPKLDVKSFTHFKGYHACRPRDISTYLNTVRARSLQYGVGLGLVSCCRCWWVNAGGDCCV